MRVNASNMTQQLAALELDKSAADDEAAEAQISAKSDLQTARRHDAEVAIQKAKEAAEDAGFWGDVAEVATVAAAVGGVVAAAGTGGSSLVVAMAVTGAIGTMATQTKTGQEFLRDDVGMSDDAILATGVASMALSVGAGVGAAASSQAGSATLRAAGAMTGGAGGAVGGVAFYGQRSAESRGKDAQHDAKVADRHVKEAGYDIDDSIDRIKRQHAQHSSNLAQLRELQQSSQDSLTFLIQRG